MTTPKSTTVIFDPCGHSLALPGNVLAIYRRNRISIWCPLCASMRRWTEGKRAGSRRTRYSDRRRAASGMNRREVHSG